MNILVFRTRKKYEKKENKNYVQDTTEALDRKDCNLLSFMSGNRVIILNRGSMARKRTGRK